MRALNKIKTEWSANFAYAIGLLTTDGNLSPDGRHIIFTSKDIDLIDNFQKSLDINYHIGKKSSGSQREKKYFVVQIGSVLFYKFLLSIGLMPRKTKILRNIAIPENYFFDFLRGHLDGDGCFYSYWDPRWKSSFMFYTVFTSASPEHIKWLRQKIAEFTSLKGHITKSQNSSLYQLKYAKSESLKLLSKIYYNQNVVCLKRKLLKIEKAIKINNFARVEKLADSHP